MMYVAQDQLTVTQESDQAEKWDSGVIVQMAETIVGKVQFLIQHFKVNEISLQLVTSVQKQSPLAQLIWNSSLKKKKHHLTNNW